METNVAGIKYSYFNGLQKDSVRQIEDKICNGFRGYPMGTLAFYGPNHDIASKLVVGIMREPDGDIVFMEKWFVKDEDIRCSGTVMNEVLEFLEPHKILSVVAYPSIIGCPHEEGIDYPDGKSCSRCSYWVNRNRWVSPA